MATMSENLFVSAKPRLTVVEGGNRRQEPCAICGEEVDTIYVWMDWGAGREAICGRACANTGLDALDAFLRRPSGHGNPSP